MCDDGVWGDPFFLKYVPDWFVTQELITIWYDGDDHCNNNELIKWYDRYQKHKVQKAHTQKELMSIA